MYDSLLHKIMNIWALKSCKSLLVNHRPKPMSKIVFLDSYTLFSDNISRQPLESLGEITFYDRTPSELVIERAKDSEIVLTNKCKITKEIIAQLPNLRYIGVTATGYNVVDTQAAKDAGIIVTNAKNYSTNSVAQHTFALMLTLLTRIDNYAPKVAEEWTRTPDFCYYYHSMTELSGKTLGLVGLGDIAQKVAKIALAFDMRVVANRRNPLKGGMNEIELVSLDELLEMSDFVSLHCPLTIDNEAFINQERLSKMKKTAYIINTARGALINEKDLADALNNGTIAGAGLDVLSVEPPSAENPLLSAKNCIITPHQAWATVEARTRLLEIVAENIRMFWAGNPQNVVNL